MSLSKFIFNLAGILITFCTFSKDNTANAAKHMNGLHDNKSKIMTSDHGCGCGCGSCTQNEITPQEEAQI